MITSEALAKALRSGKLAYLGWYPQFKHSMSEKESIELCESFRKESYLEGLNDGKRDNSI
jgi:hypothetical protein